MSSHTILSIIRKKTIGLFVGILWLRHQLACQSGTQIDGPKCESHRLTQNQIQFNRSPHSFLLLLSVNFDNGMDWTTSYICSILLIFGIIDIVFVRFGCFIYEISLSWIRACSLWFWHKITLHIFKIPQFKFRDLKWVWSSPIRGFV